MPQRELTDEIIEDFLLKTAQKKMPFRIQNVVGVESVTEYSNLNHVWKSVVQKRNGKTETIFIKQGKTHRRESSQTGVNRENHDIGRTHGEYAMLKHLHKIWGKGYIPTVYYFSPRDSILVLSDVSKNAKVLIEDFAEGQLHETTGAIFGRLFGKLHTVTYGTIKEYCGTLTWRKTMNWLFDDYFGAGMRNNVPVREVDVFYRKVSRAKHSWILGDPLYRNIFIRKRSTTSLSKVSMIDFDHAQTYDPAADCGMLLAHWAWMNVKSAKYKTPSSTFMHDFWIAYKKEFNKKKLCDEINDLADRVFKWMGIYLVSRVDGRKSYFAKWPAWEKRIRELGVDLFTERQSKNADHIRSLF